MDERYLSQIEQSRTSAKPLPLEVIENVQEAIWSGISGSVKAVLHRLVDMALADEATERVGAARHERSASRRAHRNGTYRRDLQTTLGPINEAPVPSEVRYLFLDGQNHKVRTEFGVTDRQMLAAFAVLPDGSERLLGYRLGEGESAEEWALLLDGNDNFTWPHRDDLIWPHPSR